MGASRIPDYTRREVVDAYNGFCACRDCFTKAQEVHHIISNSKMNVKKYPFFINSPINLRPICRKHHDSKEMYQFIITDKQARMYEDFLQELKEVT